MGVNELLERLPASEITYWQALAEIRNNEAEANRSRSRKPSGRRFRGR
jgi:hypothetical protein